MVDYDLLVPYGWTERQVLAANVDTVLICTAADSDVDPGRRSNACSPWPGRVAPMSATTGSRDRLYTIHNIRSSSDIMDS